MNDNDNRKRDIFYGIVAIATLIIALVGATLAYFSITVYSEDDAVNASAAIVSVEYSDGQNIIAQAKELIPATIEIVQDVYEHNLQALNNQIEDGVTSIDDKNNICLDSNNQEVCSVFRFSMKSDLTRIAKAILQVEKNEFEYLAYTLRDVTNSSWLILDENTGSQSISLTKCDNSSTVASERCYNTVNSEKVYNAIAKKSIFGYNTNSEEITRPITDTKQEYDLIIFIKENNANQDVDQGKSFSGTLAVEVIDRITGENNW